MNRTRTRGKRLGATVIGILCLAVLLVGGSSLIIQAQQGAMRPAHRTAEGRTTDPPVPGRGPRCQDLDEQLDYPEARRSPAGRQRSSRCQQWASLRGMPGVDPFTRTSPHMPSDKARLSGLKSSHSTDRRAAVIVQLDQPAVAQFRLEQLMPELKASQRLSSDQQVSLRQYADGLTRAQDRVIDAVRQRGIDLKVKQRYRYTFNGIAVEIPVTDVGQLKQVPGVRAMFPDRPRWATLDESVPLIGAPNVWDMQDELGRFVRGQGVVVAVIDTGIDYTHPDLGSCSAAGSGCRVAGGYDFVNDDNDPFDDNGHGTHVAGIVGANGTLKGVAPLVTFHAYKVLNQYGSGSDSQIIAGVERAVDPDQDPGTDDAVDVMNLSLGGLGDQNDPLTVAVENAVSLGVVAAISAGNSGDDNFTVESPGNAQHAITVGATHKGDALADFSSRGPVPQGWLLKPDIVAPGVSISSTIPGNLYDSFSGTSMAAPHVAGAAALLRQLHPSWTPSQIKSALVNRALDLGYAPIEQGTGRLDLPAATDPPTLVSPTSLGLGVDYYQDQATWSETATFTITNRSGLSATYAISLPTTLPAGVTVGLSAISATLEAGQSTGIDVTINVNNQLVTPPGPPAYTVSDTLTIGAPGQPNIHLPFGFGMFSGVDAYEPDNSLATASPITTDGTPQTHNFHVANDEDWVKFQATSGTNYVIETQQIFDYKQYAILELYDTDGTTLLADNYQILWWYQSRIEWTAPSDGTYYIRVVPGWEEIFFGDITQYDLAVFEGGEGTIGPDAYEGDDTPASAYLVSPNGVVHHHNFFGAGDVDWAKFEANKGEAYIIETTRLRFMADTILELYDTDGSTLLRRDDDSSGSDTWGSFIEWTAPADGTYFVKVSNYVDETFGTQYDLVIRPRGMDIAGQIGGGMLAVDVTGTYAVVGHGPRVSVIDVSNSATPRLLGQTNPLGDIVFGLDVVGNIAHVADGSGGFYTVSLADPANPQVLDFYDIWAFDVTVVGNTAYVAGGWQVLIFSVADPADITLLGSLDISDGWTEAIASAGSYVYAADVWIGLRVINVADPATPVQEATVNHRDGWPTDVAVAGQYAYMTSYPDWVNGAPVGGGIQAIDIISPTNATEVGYLDSGDVEVWGLDVAGDVAHLARGWDRVQLVSIADPANMTERSQVSTRDWAEDIRVANGTAYVADDGGGLRIIDVSDPDNPAEAGAYEPPGTIWDVALSGSTAVVVDGPTLRTFNITNPFSPLEQGVLDLDTASIEGWSREVALTGNTAYVAAGWAGLLEVDVNNPGSPTITGSLDLGDWTQTITLQDGYAIAAGWNLNVVSITTPGSPTLQGSLSLPSYPWGLDASGNTVLVADGYSGLRIVSIVDPANPVEVGDMRFNGFVSEVAVQNDVAYVTEYPWWTGTRYTGGGLWAISIADPANPFILGYYDTLGWPTSVTLIGGVAYIGDSGTFRGIFVQDSGEMHGIQFHDVLGDIRGAAGDGEYIAVAGVDGGLWILSRHPCAGNPGDLNCDGATDALDLGMATPHWRSKVIGAPFDRDFNLWIDVIDFISLVQYWAP